MNTKSKHFNKYNQIVKDNKKMVENMIGDAHSYLGISSAGWRELYKQDENLNNYPLKRFDGNYIRGLGLTLAESVCLHKHIIRYYIVGVENEDKVSIRPKITWERR